MPTGGALDGLRALPAGALEGLPAFAGVGLSPATGLDSPPEGLRAGVAEPVGLAPGVAEPAGLTAPALVADAVRLAAFAPGVVPGADFTAAMAFEIVKWTGAAYLVVLGSWTIWRAGKDVPDEKPRVLNHPYVQALLTQLGNPKTVLFFGALLPQFLDVNRPLWPQYLLMWAIVAAGETLIVGGYAWIASRGGQLVHPRFAAWRERASGAVMIFIGAIFATVRR